MRKMWSFLLAALALTGCAAAPADALPAAETAETLAADPDRLMRYLALRIMMRLAPQMPERAAAMARAELARTDALTSLATSLADNAAEYQN